MALSSWFILQHQAQQCQAQQHSHGAHDGRPKGKKEAVHMLSHGYKLPQSKEAYERQVAQRSKTKHLVANLVCSLF
jgi:hypothetical protein